MDVATFMATISPIAAVAVLPLAIANGDVFGMSGTGWTYMLILTFLTGVAAHGLHGLRAEDDPDRHDRHRPGRAARARGRVVVPVAGRDAERWQVVGIAIVMSGLLAFLVLNERGNRPGGRAGRGDHARRERGRRRSDLTVTRAASDRSLALPTQRASVRSSSVMKCEAASMRRSAASHRLSAAVDVARLGRDAGERVEGEHLDGGVAVAPCIVEDRDEPLLGARDAVRGVHRGEQALAERGLLAATGVAVPRGRRLERRPRSCALPERAQDAPEVHPGERGHADVAGGLRLLDREFAAWRAPALVVAGLALRPPEAGDLVGLGLQEAESPRRLRRAADVQRRRRRTGAGRGPARRASRRRGRGATGRRPSAASAATWSRASTLRSWSPAEIAALAAKSQFAAWSHGRSSPS